MFNATSRKVEDLQVLSTRQNWNGVFGLLLMCVCVLSMAGTLSAATIYVDDDAPAGTAERTASDDDPPIPHEVPPSDPPRPLPAEPPAKAIPHRGPWTHGRSHSIQVNVEEFGNNIMGDAANEPSIAVDPTDPRRIAIGWRQFDSVYSNFRQAGWGYTEDGGQSWTFPGRIEPGIFRSDPVLDSDADGVFYYNSLTYQGAYLCNVFRSHDGGASWDAGVFAYGGDKQWQAIDRTNGPGRNNLYAYWSESYSACDGNFTRSYDGGDTYRPCTSVPGNPHWGVLDVGPDGELYVVGSGFTLAKSSTMQYEGQPTAWDFYRTVDLDGYISSYGGPNPGGLLGQAWVAVDHSPGPQQGNVYVLCSVRRSSTADPLDVMFARSTDGGLTFSVPVRVNDDPESNGAYQWFGTMSVAPNGRIDVIWNDTRNDPGGYDSALYYAYSSNAGQTWSRNRALSPPFDPHLGWPNQDKIGDYYDMVSDDLGANVAYAATFNGEQDVYFLRIWVSIAGTIYVDDDAPNDPGPGDPTLGDPLEVGSLDHPFDSIQEGIDAAIDEVIVFDGTYAGVSNRDLNFGGKNIAVHSENGPEHCIIDCEHAGRGFRFHSGEGPAAVVEGFTITNGQAGIGGGIYCASSSPTITNCAIVNNTADYQGGGIFCVALGNPRVTNCTIAHNTAVYISGGAIYSTGTSSPAITNCILWSDYPQEVDAVGALITYTDIQGGWPGEGNLDLEPLFVDPDGPDGVPGTEDDNFHLLPNSPCIDAGDPASEFGFEPEPDGRRVNMGAYGNTPEAATRGWLYITGYEQVSKTRVGRTTFEYELKLTIENVSPDDASNVLAELLDMPEGVTIVENQVFVGDLPAGSSVMPADTFALQVDRALVIDPLWISWRVEYTRGGRSEESVVGTWLDLKNLGSPRPPAETGPTLLPEGQLQPVPTEGKP